MADFPMKWFDKPKPIEIRYQYEDELPENLRDDIYDAMFPSSFVDFVRMFPVLVIENRRFYLIEDCDALEEKESEE